MKLDWINPNICWEMEGAGAGGGEAEPPAFSWGDDLDEEVMSFVGDKTPQEIAIEALGHKRGATQREEQMIERLGSDEEFTKNFAEKHGLSKMPEDDKAFIEMAKSRISEDAKYEHPKIDGADESLMGVYASVARESGIAPEQYKGFMGKVSEGVREMAKQSAEKVDADLKAEWGDNYDENNVQVENFLRTIGDESGNLLGVLANFPPAQQVKAAQVLADLGRRVGSAETNSDAPSDVGGAGGSSMTWDEAKTMIAEKGWNKMTEYEREEATKARQAEKAK